VFLDAGAGSGHFSLAAAQIVGAEGKVYAVDIYAEDMAALRNEAKRLGLRNVEAIVADITQAVPLPDASVDVCLMVNVLHGFVANGETAAAMGEIARVVKPGGVFAVAEWKKSSPTGRWSWRRLAREIKRRLSHVSPLFASGPPQNIRLSADEVAAAVTPFGFRSARAEDPNPKHTLVVFQR
jgi:ubiquinone/menaquinone biosynthesis C-methylase UbiE